MQAWVHLMSLDSHCKHSKTFDFKISSFRDGRPLIANIGNLSELNSLTVVKGECPSNDDHSCQVSNFMANGPRKPHRFIMENIYVKQCNFLDRITFDDDFRWASTRPSPSCSASPSPTTSVESDPSSSRSDALMSTIRFKAKNIQKAFWVIHKLRHAYVDLFFSFSQFILY